MKVARIALFSLFTLTAMGLATTGIAADVQGQRPLDWAQSIAMKGVPNLHKVSDGLYRSAQPTTSGLENLKKMGVTTVINLRAFDSDQQKIRQTGLASEHISMKAWHPEEEDAVRFLRIVTNSGGKSVLVHCQAGADRTGTMCAIYRIAVQGWTKEEAIREMTEGGFGFHQAWANLAPWVDGLDIEKIRREAGIAYPQPK